MSLPFGRQLLGLFPTEFVEAPALHLTIEHFQVSAAGIHLVVMGQIGEAFEDAEQFLVPGPRRIFTLPARHGELSGPNRVRLSPLCGAGETVKPHQMKCLALPACPGSWLNPMRTRLPSRLTVLSKNAR